MFHVPDPSTGKPLTVKRTLLIAGSSMVGFFAGLTALHLLERITGRERDD